MVCRACNNGWLSQLETIARPLLSDLVCGYARTLTVADQKLLATWIAKTTMTAEYIAKDQVAIHQATRDRFYAAREPAPNWQMWAAYYTGTNWRRGNIYHHGVGMYLPPLTMQPGVKNTQHTVMALGHFLCICTSSEDERVGVKLDDRLQSTMKPSGRLPVLP